MAEILIDTNVLVYAHDRSEPVKQKQAIEVLKMLQVAGVGHLSAQCLSEFFSAVTRGGAPKLTLFEAAQQADRLARVWPVLGITSQIVLEATRGVCDHQLNFWDAQVWAAARLNQIPVVFSEDFGTGTVIEGVRFVNPFSDDFDPHAWGL